MLKEPHPPNGITTSWIQYPGDLAWADSAAGIEEAFKDGKIASLIGVESGHAIGSSLGKWLWKVPI